MTLTPTAVHETLDERGLLDDAHRPGCYGLRVRTPSLTDEVAQSFREHSDVTPPEKIMDRLASAGRVAYVGASGNVYDRLQDHARGDVRKALFLRCFPPVDVVGVWPSEAPFESEFNRARALSEENWTVWTDGELL
jgi:hypothetical protein